MKLIIAYIQPERLPHVKHELAKAEISRMSVTNALGCGSQQGFTETYRGADHEVNLLKKVRLELAVTEPFIQKAIDSIVAGARTGKIGDGKIFILDLPRIIRIRTGEEGDVAVG